MMKARVMKYFFAAGFFLALAGNAQDIHFSQFYDSPLLLNPAAAGASADYRLAINYKNQWKSVINPFKTAALAFDAKLMKAKKNNFGVGVSLFNDKVGVA